MTAVLAAFGIFFFSRGALGGGHDTGRRPFTFAASASLGSGAMGLELPSYIILLPASGFQCLFWGGNSYWLRV